MEIRQNEFGPTNSSESDTTEHGKYGMEDGILGVHVEIPGFQLDTLKSRVLMLLLTTALRYEYDYDPGLREVEYEAYDPPGAESTTANSLMTTTESGTTPTSTT
ncbi:hypothetical protein AAG570_008446 [Ranatra chinensis]|uniref:Uncharacterized protein n=1 Tax=Ranatra chinensis TaxID=642074 RepID=A0ABD0Z3U1_9HEMI